MKNRTRRILSNQAIGILPILASMILDLYVSYVMSFLIGLSFCLLLLLAFHLVVRKDVYQFLLIPTLIAYIFYSFFLFFDMESVLNIYSPLIAEILLVAVLGFIGFFKRRILAHYKDMHRPYQVLFRSTLAEAFFVGEVIQTLYTLYLFAILIYTHLPENSFDNAGFVRVIYHYVGALIGLVVICYEQIRLILLDKKLGEEVWLPLLNDRGRVVGSFAYSTGRVSHKKYFHPVVRVAVLYKGLLYLAPREDATIVSPGLLDHPFRHYVQFRHSREGTVHSIIGALGNDPSVKTRFMIHYTFENSKVKQLVSLYAISLQNEAQLEHLTGGKLWTTKQIESELEANIFSEYFSKEYLYLKNTILLAESVSPGT
jgi:hypothetical protein